MRLARSDSRSRSFCATQRRRGHSPNLYEDFLQAYAPEQRRTLGVYYTPAQLVAAHVRLAADLLEQRLGCAAAFGDEQVLMVDPATGSGAYPLAVVTNTLERGPTDLVCACSNH